MKQIEQFSFCEKVIKLLRMFPQISKKRKKEYVVEEAIVKQL